MPLMSGVLVLLAVILLSLRHSDLQAFGNLASQATPQWLLIAVMAQGCTYFATAWVWQGLLAATGCRLRLMSLLPLGFVKLFADQVVPTGGLSGTMLIVVGFRRRGVQGNQLAAALFGTLVTYYGAYALGAIATVCIFLWRGADSDLVIGLAALLLIVAIGIPILVLGLAVQKGQGLPDWLRRYTDLTKALGIFSGNPLQALKAPKSAARALAGQFAIFLCDAVTLSAASAALGQAMPGDIAFAGLLVGMMVATLAPVPLGLGTYEGGTVVALHTLGIPVEAALAATLLARGFTFWLPMLPGLWLTRKELGHGN
jgi:glycosyltransferase 2 family protein